MIDEIQIYVDARSRLKRSLIKIHYASKNRANPERFLIFIQQKKDIFKKLRQLDKTIGLLQHQADKSQFSKDKKK